MKKTYQHLNLVIVITISLLFLVSCSNKEQTDIITTLYPQYDIAKQIAGDKLSVSLMTPFGTEVHAYEPTAKDIIRVKNSKLFIYTSDRMERWAKNIISDQINALNLANSYTLLPYKNANSLVDDLHYWTDPITIISLIKVINEEIIKIDPINKDYYQNNANMYIDEITIVHNQLNDYFSDKKNPAIFFYGHNALASFGSRYDLNIVSLSTNYKPDAELSPGQIVELKKRIKEANSKYLFVEELIDLKAPNSLKDELKREGYEVTILELHGFHNISKKQNDEGVRYVDLLKQNLENLKRAIN